MEGYIFHPVSQKRLNIAQCCKLLMFFTVHLELPGCELIIVLLQVTESDRLQNRV